MHTYTVRVNGRAVVTTESMPRLFAYLHDLRTAAGPVTVEEDGREMTAHEVEELMLSYHRAPQKPAPLPTETAESLLSEAMELEARALQKERQANAEWCKSPDVLRHDAEIFREEAASKRRRAAHLAGVASY